MAQKKVVSKHSRAARRATAVDIDTDKSLKDVVPPKATKHRPSVLAAHQSAGVTKKQKASRRNKMSAKARKRHERGLEMAEAVIERTSKKKEKSFAKSRNIQDRAKGWDDINKDAAEEEAQADEGLESRNRFEAAGGEDWETDEEIPTAGDEVVASDAAVAQTTELRDDDDDVIL